MGQMVEQVPIGSHMIQGEGVGGTQQKIWDVAEQGVLRINLWLLNSNEHKKALENICIRHEWYSTQKKGTMAVIV